MTDLLELINKRNQEEINAYLGDVPWQQFIEDVKSLINKTADKELIKKAIKDLEKFL